MNLGIDKILPFGKYKGLTVKYVAEHDVNYLFWCFDNIGDHILSDEAFKYVLKKKKQVDKLKESMKATSYYPSNWGGYTQEYYHGNNTPDWDY